MSHGIIFKASMHTFYSVLHGIALSVKFICSQKGSLRTTVWPWLVSKPAEISGCKCSRNLDWILFSDFQNTWTDLVNLFFRKHRHPQEPWRSANDIMLGHLLYSQVSAYKNMHVRVNKYIYMYICISTWIIILYSLCQKQIDAICRTSRQKERRIESNQCASIFELTWESLKIRRL